MTNAALLTRLGLAVLVQPVLFALLLFVPAGTLAWPRAWVLIAIVFVATVGSLVLIYPRGKDLLVERLKPPIQKAQPRADKIVVVLLLVTWVAAVQLVPEDVFRVHLLPPPPPAVSAAGLGLFLAGWWLITRALQVNAFATPVVKDQSARHQRVIDVGPYAVVRHPMYAGSALFMIGMPLWLESYAGALAALAPLAVLVLRIGIEERFLRARLPQYELYAARVPARIIPGVW